MDVCFISSLKRKTSFHSFHILSCPDWAMPVTLWHTGLLLCFLGVCSCLEEECVLGIVGRPVSLPCIVPQLSVANLSIEWRRGSDVIVRCLWKEDGDLEEWSINRATISADAALTGNISLELPLVDPAEHNTTYSLFITSGEEKDTAQCTVCLSVAASYSYPVLQREEAESGEETSFFCHSSGGFPAPVVHWFINYTKQPPRTSVWTLVEPLPGSKLFNITSHLRVNISKDTGVSCTIENPSMNENLTVVSGAPASPVVSRASEAMWIFSTALCVVVGVLVAIGVGYQIHLDRVSKKKKREIQYLQSHSGNRKRRFPDPDETEVMRPDGKETDV